jgi:hypothetical protein
MAMDAHELHAGDTPDVGLRSFPDRAGREHDHAVDDQVVSSLDVPVLSGLQAQGDLLVVPGTAHRWQHAIDIRPVPAAGIAVLRGEHDHTLVADPDACRYATPSEPNETCIGLIEVTATAYVVHLEHATIGIGPGVYALHRQREAMPRPLGSKFDLSRPVCD